MNCYVVIYDQSLNVLVAQKNIIGERFDGKPTAPKILNYSGQVVFPGGDPKISNTTAGALKEFMEETGLDLNSYIDKGKMWTKDFQGFSATFCYIKDNKKGDLIRDAISNIKSGSTQDDELKFVYFLDYNTAYTTLKTWDSNLTTPEAEQELFNQGSVQGKDLFEYRDKSWFKAMMDELNSHHPF